MISNRIADMLRELFRQEPEAASTRMVGEVLGVDEDGTAWVHVLGGVDRTPVSATNVQLSKGDIVNLYVGDGRAEVVGNRSDPAPTTTQLRKVDRSVSDASRLAAEANEVATATNQHFWSDGNGIHVAETEREQWEQQPSGSNVTINSLGILFRVALSNLVTMTQGAVAFYDGLGNSASNIVAFFGRTGSQIGKSDEAHMTQSATATKWYGEDGTAQVAELSTSSDGFGMWLVDKRKRLFATNGATDNVSLINYGTNNSHEAEIRLDSYGTSGRATLIVSSNDVDADVDVTPSKMQLKVPLYVGVAGGSAVNVEATGYIEASDGSARVSGDSSYIYLRDAQNTLWRLVKSSGNVQFYDSGSWVSLFYNSKTSRTANTVLAAPNGSSGAASFRKLAQADLPANPWTKIVSDFAGDDSTAKALSLTDYSEILVVAKYGSTYASSLVIPKAALASSYQDWYLGGWYRTTTFAAAARISSSSIKPYSGYVDGTSRSLTWSVYARK